MSRYYPLKVMWTDTLKWAMVAFISTGYRALSQFFSEAAKIVSPPWICDAIFDRIALLKEDLAVLVNLRDVLVVGASTESLGSYAGRLLSGSRDFCKRSLMRTLFDYVQDRLVWSTGPISDVFPTCPKGMAAGA